MVLILAAFVLTLNQTLVNPVLPSVMKDFNVTSAVAQWLSSGFTMMNAIMVPITAYLTDRFSARKLFVFSMGTFVVGAAFCGWAPNFTVLLIGRILQAIGDGTIMPLTMIVMMLVFPIHRRGTALGLFGVVIAFAPAIGPTVGGIIIDTFSWQWLFRAVFVLAVAITLAVPLICVNIRQGSNKPKLDVLSVILSVFGFGGMLYSFSTISEGELSIPNIVGGIIGLVGIIWFFVRQLHLDVPLLRVRVMKVPEFSIALVIMILVQAGLMAGAILMPIYIQQLRGMSATLSGIIVLPGAILLGVMGPVAGRMFDYRGARGIAIFGTSLLVVTTIAFCFLSDHTPIVLIAVIYTVRLLGISFVNMPINTWGMNSLDNSVINHGTSLTNTARQVAGSFGTALMVSIMHFVSTHIVQGGSVEANIKGVNAAFVASSLLAIVAWVLVILYVRDRPHRTKETTTPAEA